MEIFHFMMWLFYGDFKITNLHFWFNLSKL